MSVKLDEQRKNRIAAAVTVNVILLIVILAAVLIYQMVELVYVSNETKRIKEEIDDYTTKIEQAQDDIDYLKSEQGLFDLALQNGFRFPKN